MNFGFRKQHLSLGRKKALLIKKASMYSSSENVGTMPKNENSESSFELHTKQNEMRNGTADNVSGTESTPLVGGGDVKVYRSR